MSSSDEFEPETTRSSSSKKRKSNGSSNTDAKKPRKVAKITDHSAAEELVEQVFDNPDYWLEAEAEELRDTVYTLAEYARDLRNALAAQDANGQQSSAPKQSREELVKTAEKLRKTAKSQIKLQMKWKESCRTGTAKWCYEGVCPNPDTFGVLMGATSAPKWKQKRLSHEEFNELVDGQITAPVRYDTLFLTGTGVNVKWEPETGEFKFSGTYGKRERK